MTDGPKVPGTGTGLRRIPCGLDALSDIMVGRVRTHGIPPDAKVTNLEFRFDRRQVVLWMTSESWSDGEQIADGEAAPDLHPTLTVNPIGTQE